MQAAKVPQHLELDDVVAWGLGAVDLLCVIAGAGAGWWLYLNVPTEPVLRIAAATPPVALGIVIGVLRVGDRSLREWLALALRYAQRAHILVAGEPR